MKNSDFDYNTKREKLILPEYGRNVQKLVKHLFNIQSREERNRYAQALIQVMGNLNPHLRDTEDFKHKLWDHLAIISEFKGDYDSPYPIPTPEIISEKPKKVPYGTTDLRYKHYGKNVERLIKKACQMPEGEEKQAFIMIVANLMKRFYYVWNKESVTDEVIINDLKELSDGQIVLDPGTKLEEIKPGFMRQKKQPQNMHKNHTHQNGHGNHNYKKRH